MLISRICPHEEQTRLWPDDRAILSPAQLRPFCGAFFEEVARAAFGLHRHQTDSCAEVCPDLSDGGKKFAEVKSLRHGNAGIIYQSRLLRDRKLLRQTRGSLTYVFFIHRANIADIRTLHRLRLALAHSLERVVCIPLRAIEETCHALPRKRLNYRSGGLEMLGFRLPWSWISGYAQGQSYFIPGLQAYGIGLPGVRFVGRP